jgi:hypothetical protein
MVFIAGVRRDAELPCFVTITYPNEFPTVEGAKRDLKIFLQRMARAWPGCGAVWKLEPQERGAPHFHMLVWGMDEGMLLAWVVNNWYEIAGHGDENHRLFHLGVLANSRPCVSKVRSWRGVWSYASKYIGKTFEVAEWGGKWTGRFWGKVKTENIPLGELHMISIDREELFRLFRLERRFAHIKKQPKNSLMIFCDADQWIEKLYPDVDTG